MKNKNRKTLSKETVRFLRKKTILHLSLRFPQHTFDVWSLMSSLQSRRRPAPSRDFLQSKYELENGWYWWLITQTGITQHAQMKSLQGSLSRRGPVSTPFLYNECKIVQYLNESWSLSNVKIPSLLVPVKKNSFYSLGSFRSCS